ncbi:MAG: four helix bundle protein, partial [Gemmatimonadaceae bacterium]
MQDFRNIEAWQLCRPMVVDVYRLTKRFPREELFGLTSQLRRSASAIGAAIAEAFGRSTRADCARCLQTAISEANEAIHHLITALDLGYVNDAEYHQIETQVTTIRHKAINLVLR